MNVHRKFLCFTSRKLADKCNWFPLGYSLASARVQIVLQPLTDKGMTACFHLDNVLVMARSQVWAMLHPSVNWTNSIPHPLQRNSASLGVVLESPILWAILSELPGGQRAQAEPQRTHLLKLQAALLVLQHFSLLIQCRIEFVSQQLHHNGIQYINRREAVRHAVEASAEPAQSHVLNLSMPLV